MDLAAFLPKPKKGTPAPTVNLPEHTGRLTIVDGQSGKGILTSTMQNDAQGLAVAIAQQGHKAGRLVKATLADQQPLPQKREFRKPPPEERDRRLAEVKAALETILGRRIESVQIKSIGEAAKAKPTEQLLEYRPEREGDPTRIIRLVEAPRDPLQPPSFRHQRSVRPPPSPPAPVLHSPPRKATAAEQRAWQIPPCVSNWINPAGYTIPLDKRLAADGRGLQEASLNHRHASMAEALYMAESAARQEVERRAAVEAMLEGEELAKREENLRRMADQARQERLAVIKAMQEEEEARNQQRRQRSRSRNRSDNMERRDRYDDRYERRDRDRSRSRDRHQLHDREERYDRSRRDSRSRDYPERDHHDSREHEDGYEGDRRDSNDRARYDRSEEVGLREREHLRKKLQYEMEREMKIAKMRPEQREIHANRADDREVSERIALGRLQPRLEGEALFDQRLFDRSAGLGSGLAGEDATMLYDQPLFKTNLANTIYRPREQAGGEEGAEETRGLGSTGPSFKRGPVEFEPAKPTTTTTKINEEDPFGLDSFLQEAKAKKPRQ